MTYPQGWQTAEVIRLLYSLKVLNEDTLHDVVDQIQIAIWMDEIE